MTALDFMAQSPDLANVVCLQKPFRPNELLQAVKLAQSQASSPAARGPEPAAV
jgi:DNA-binding response OmpR family regulator